MELIDIASNIWLQKTSCNIKTSEKQKLEQLCAVFIKALYHHQALVYLSEEEEIKIYTYLYLNRLSGETLKTAGFMQSIFGSLWLAHKFHLDNDISPTLFLNHPSCLALAKTEKTLIQALDYRLFFDSFNLSYLASYASYPQMPFYYIRFDLTNMILLPEGQTILFQKQAYSLQKSLQNTQSPMLPQEQASSSTQKRPNL
jgi:hypothetical protein